MHFLLSVLSPVSKKMWISVLLDTMEERILNIEGLYSLYRNEGRQVDLANDRRPTVSSFFKFHICSQII